MIVDSWRDDPLLAVAAAAWRAHRHPARRCARRTCDHLRRRALRDPRPDGGVRPLPRPRRRPARGCARGRAHAGRRARARPARRSRRLARRPRRAQAPASWPVRERPPARPSHPRGCAVGDRRPATGVRRARRARRRRRRTSSSRPCSTRSLPGGSSGSLTGRGLVEEAGAGAPRRGPVPPARPRAALGGRARAGLGRPARFDAGGARRRRADRRGASRARARRSGRRRARSRRAALQPPRHALRNEDRARRRRPGALRDESTRAARAACSPRSTERASSGACPAGAGGRRATRSSTTCSRPPCSPGAAGRTALERSAPPRGGATGGSPSWPSLRSSRSPARRRSPRGRSSQRAEAREKALAADAGALTAKARELEANAIVQLGRGIPSSGCCWRRALPGWRRRADRGRAQACPARIARPDRRATGISRE